MPRAAAALDRNCAFGGCDWVHKDPRASAGGRKDLTTRSACIVTPRTRCLQVRIRGTPGIPFELNALALPWQIGFPFRWIFTPASFCRHKI